MKTRKMMALLLTATVSTSSLVACGSSGEKADTATEAASKESSKTADIAGATEAAGPVSITCVTTLADVNYPVAENYAFLKASELANVEFVMEAEFSADVSKEKANLLINSGDYPEFFYKMKNGNIDTTDLGLKGIAIPVEDLIKEYMPNLTALLDERNAWEDMRASDGHIYDFPKVGRPNFLGGSTGCLFINEKWLNELGLDLPNSMESLYQVLKAFKEQDANGNGDPNDEIPLNAEQISGSRGLNKLMVYMGGVYHYYDLNLAVTDDQELIYVPYSDYYREYLDWAAKFYEEGLICEDFLTNSYDEFCAVSKGSADNILGSVMTNRMNRMLTDEYCGDYRDVPSFDLNHVALSTGLELSGTCITDKCENPEAICKFLDWFYTEEGYLTAEYGIEGEHYTRNADGAVTKVEGANYCGLTEITGIPGDSSKKVDTSSFMYDAGHVYDPNAGLSMPELKLTDDEKESISIISTDLSAYIESFFAKVVLGETRLTDEAWDNFKADLKKIGADTYLETYQAAYARNLAQ